MNAAADGEASLPPSWALIPCLAHKSCTREVTDADEEVFYLYTVTAAPTGRVGLGQVDGSHDFLSISVNASGEDKSKPEITIGGADESEHRAQWKASASAGNKSVKGRSRSSKATHAREGDSSQSTSVVLRQDSTSLRSSNGDTGSVVWRSSIFLTAKIFADLCIQRRTDDTPAPLLATSRLVQSTVLELGAGTGILPALLFSRPDLLQCSLNASSSSSAGFSPSSLRWLATDQESIFGLLSKNIRSTQTNLVDRGFAKLNVDAAVLDWVQASQLWQDSNPSSSSVTRFREQVLSSLTHSSATGSLEVHEDHGEQQRCPDLIIATDCIFNAHLLQPFLNTLTLFAIPNHTLVLVVCELREPELIRELLQMWLTTGPRGEQWHIVALQKPEEDHDGDDDPVGSTAEAHKSIRGCALGAALERGAVGWVAWRVR